MYCYVTVKIDVSLEAVIEVAANDCKMSSVVVEVGIELQTLIVNMKVLIVPEVSSWDSFLKASCIHIRATQGALKAFST